MSDLVDQKIQSIAQTVAHEEWEQRTGFGLYHASEEVQAAEVASAEKKVRKWLARFEDVIREDERQNIVKHLRSDEVYYLVDDNWGSSGDAALKAIIEILDR